MTVHSFFCYKKNHVMKGVLQRVGANVFKGHVYQTIIVSKVDYSGNKNKG